MMKRYVLTAAALLALTTSKAQRVDLDRFNFNFQYRNLPSNPLDSTYKTFSVSVDAPSTIENSMSREAIANAVNLQGFTRADRSGDVQIHMRFQDIFIDKYQVIESVSETKEKDGSVTKNYSYYISLDYTMKGTADFKDRNGAELKKGISLFQNSTYNWASSTYKARGDASAYYYNNKQAIINNLVRDRMNEAIAEANRHVNKYYGFPVTNSLMHLWLLDSKKHEEYEAMDARWKALKPVLENVTANTLSEEAISKIKEMIKYFDELKTKYNKDEKGDRKMRYAAYYNNAILYMILDMPDKATEEANGLIKNDYDTKDGEHLNESAQELMTLFNINHWNTRHFVK